MAARDWRDRQDRKVCRDCGRTIEPKRLAAGMRCCRGCAKTRANDVAARRLRHKISAMKPTVGRIVIYTLPVPHDLNNNGAVEAPAVVVRAFDGIEDNKVNLKVLLDGNDTTWATSVPEGTAPGTWHWPARV